MIRREQFCQIVKEIHKSNEYLIVGIDVAKDKHHAFMGTTTGKSLLRKLIFENNINGFSRLLKTVEAIKVQNGLSKIVYGLEPTGNYHKPLAGHLIGCDCNVVLVAGQAVKYNRQILDGRWDKNDTKDAANVADLVSRGKCLYYDCPSQSIIEIRALLSLRRRLKKEEHSLRMRIRNNLLALYFPELDTFYSACESETLAIVGWCLTPDTIATMEFGKFFQLVTKTRRGTAQTLRLRKIHGLAIESIGCPTGAASEYKAELLVEKLKQVRNQIKETNDLIEDFCLKFSGYSYILTIPGFGPYISARVLASIGDPFRFENRKQLIKMSGYDLCANRSGRTSDKAIPVISKKGNSELRYALYQAANVAVTKVDLFRAHFTKLLRGRERERGIKTKMRVKLAAKMLVIAWTLMKKGEVFNPDYLNIE
ncbi:MAG: IS110 family transposase [Deltaproteobacteria bacterium]|nr:IS110 family transposase [Deltaproteobacteria bacterium]MBW2166129.1 IS110 family transposase [Deltaproteobacteria bacterium]MBW2740436.1 IS110 family transposase [Deltaproteobacteria bacterium]